MKWIKDISRIIIGLWFVIAMFYLCIVVPVILFSDLLGRIVK